MTENGQSRPASLFYLPGHAVQQQWAAGDRLVVFVAAGQPYNIFLKFISLLKQDHAHDLNIRTVVGSIISLLFLSNNLIESR